MKLKTWETFLVGSRYRLNFIYIGIQVIKWSSWFSGLAGIGLWFSIWLGFQIPVIKIWLFFLILGCLPGFIYGWINRLNNYSTASWIDEHLKTGELFTAALSCRIKQVPGLFDTEILNNVEWYVLQNFRLNLPFKPLFIGTAKMLVVNVCILLLLSLGQSWFFQPNQGMIAGKTIRHFNEDQEYQKENKIPVYSPRTLARTIFPDDVKLANLAERYLRDKNMTALEELLKQSQADWSKQLAVSTNQGERLRLQEQHQKAQEMLGMLNQSSSERMQESDGREQYSDANDNEAGKNSGQSKTNPDPQKGNPRNKSNNGKFPGNQISGNYHSKTSDNLDDGFEGENYDDSSSRAGKNKNRVPQRTVLQPKASHKQIVLTPKPGQENMYILTGEDAKVPLTTVIPSSQKAAQAAMRRKSIPLEYENYVESYFVTLTKILGNQPKEDKK